MISLKIMTEYCEVKGNFASITFDLLPTTSQSQIVVVAGSYSDRDNMADLL